MHSSAALLLELGIVLTLLSIFGTWSRRLSLSPVPLYLLVGLFLGEGGIAPLPAAGEFLAIGASIGVVLLLPHWVLSSPSPSSRSVSAGTSPQPVSTSC